MKSLTNAENSNCFSNSPCVQEKKHKWREIWLYFTSSKLWLIYILWCNMTLPWAATEGNLPCNQRVVKNVSISVNPSGETFGSHSTGWDDSTPSWVGHPAPVHTVCDTRIDSSWLAHWELFCGMLQNPVLLTPQKPRGTSWTFITLNIWWGIGSFWPNSIISVSSLSSFPCSVGHFFQPLLSYELISYGQQQETRFS